MKILITTILLATVSTVSAQSMWANPPKIITYTNNATGEKIGTATISGNRVYLRDKHGEFYATVVREADGTTKWFDPNGKPIDPTTTPLPLD